MINEGILYESTGIKGRSTLRIVDLETGKTVKSHKLPHKYFGEGIAAVDGRIVQLTWTSRTGFVYDGKTLKQERTFRYGTQGWGITYDGKNLIMSDGSAMLRFMDPHTFKVRGELEVYDDKGPVRKLNELEFINGEIWANIWGSDKIARINPETGRITGWIDLSGLLPESERRGHEDVLNGIAYDKETKRLFVTGKFWPKLFEIEVTPPE